MNVFTVKKVYCNVYNYVDLSLSLLNMSWGGGHWIFDYINGIMYSFTLIIYHQQMAGSEGERAAKDRQQKRFIHLNLKTLCCGTNAMLLSF